MQIARTWVDDGSTATVAVGDDGVQRLTVALRVHATLSLLTVPVGVVPEVLELTDPPPEEAYSYVLGMLPGAPILVLRTATGAMQLYCSSYHQYRNIPVQLDMVIPPPPSPPPGG